MFSVFSSEHGVEGEEAGDGVGAVALHRAEHAVKRFLARDVARLRIELVGITD